MGAAEGGGRSHIYRCRLQQYNDLAPSIRGQSWSFEQARTTEKNKHTGRNRALKRCNEARTLLGVHS
ncbi:hypothetical protein FQN60_016396 [Etheostoma spectabile]|uniref:Uncharacterized protein n=1 Tax=Etheostoma spectabile TaxID=54343 RepID=A0A5J5D2A9_9PERO|nr:hypothetical protein FQN60_000511 [Etheostoma spectabile]KAA8587534.1 hypothetical protein FQN60_016396 [Etheostoma spectabile]